MPESTSCDLWCDVASGRCDRRCFASGPEIRGSYAYAGCSVDRFVSWLPVQIWFNSSSCPGAIKGDHRSTRTDKGPGYPPAWPGIKAPGGSGVRGR